MTVFGTSAWQENLLYHLMDNDEVTTAEGIKWLKTSDMDEEFSLRAIVPMHLMDDSSFRGRIYVVLTNVLETILSETTNNDACRITVTETSAHFHYHDLEEFEALPFASVVVYDAKIEDWLT